MKVIILIGRIKTFKRCEIDVYLNLFFHDSLEITYVRIENFFMFIHSVFYFFNNILSSQNSFFTNYNVLKFNLLLDIVTP